MSVLNDNKLFSQNKVDGMVILHSVTISKYRGSKPFEINFDSNTNFQKKNHPQIGILTLSQIDATV